MSTFKIERVCPNCQTAVSARESLSSPSLDAFLLHVMEIVYCPTCGEELPREEPSDDEPNPFDYLVAEARIGDLERRLRDCQQLATGEQSLLESLQSAYAEMALLEQERDLALLRIDELEMKLP